MSYSAWVGVGIDGYSWVGADDSSGGGGTGSYVGIFGDALSLQDSISLTGPPPDYILILGDSINYIGDSPAEQLTLLKTFNDSINNLADAVAKLVGIPIQAFDSQQFNWADALSTQLRAPLSESLSDAIVLSDAISTAVGNVPISINVADTINYLMDALRLWNVLKLDFGDNFSISDNISTKMTHLARIADSLNNYLDSIGINYTRNPHFSDQLVLNDAVSLALAANETRTASDAIALSDSVLVDLQGNYNPATTVDRIRRYLNDIN